MTPKYKRVLLKVSGEMLGGRSGNGIEPDELIRFASEIQEVAEMGVGPRSSSAAATSSVASGAARPRAWTAQAPTHGHARHHHQRDRPAGRAGAPGLKTRVMSALQMPQVCEPYIRRRALRHMEKGRVVIFAAGTGNPYFSTDTAAALRGGRDPRRRDPQGHQGRRDLRQGSRQAPRRGEVRPLTYMEVLQKGLKVMDATAISLCMDNHIPIVVFDLSIPGNIRRVVCGEEIGTVVTQPH
jgi:uridylate kinase